MTATERPVVPNVLVTVGTDHHPFGRLVAWMDDWARRHPEAQVTIQHGPAAVPRHAVGLVTCGYAELIELIGKSDVVITHAGPGTIMDARRAGRLPIIVARDPALGEVVDEHQFLFARHMVDHAFVRLAREPGELDRLVDDAIATPSAFAVSDVSEVSSATADRIDSLLRATVETRRRWRTGRLLT